ncbi:MAG TPA: class I SAM-dependent methyltransferase [Candidatus Polarisedimenticolia bacterium]|jgi:ubiquinone/menaquinone biosynthesis C-methylase UbiE
MSHDLEALISGRFDELAESSMFPHDIPPDDFALGAVLEWWGDIRGRLLLDVGCAKGRFVKALSEAGARVIGIDRTWKLLQEASRSQRDHSFVLSTATRLPFADASYDGLLCVEVIEHIPETDRAFAEMARVLKPGGRAIIIDKNLLGIGYNKLYPNWIYKEVMERLGRWFYPRDFPFKERWFIPSSLRRELRRHFSQVEVRYLDRRVQGVRRRLLAPLFKALPILRPDIAWCCRK